MALTKVKSGVRTLGTGEVTTANMAVDPTNASNLSSGDVPLAQLGNVDTATLEDDIALLGFKVAANGSLAKYNLVDQTIDAFEDTSGVNSGASTDASRNASSYYSGTSPPTGGTITTYSTYTVHSFLSGTEDFVSGGGTVNILAIGGGGSGADGGGSGAGGAGAGGLVEFSGTIATGTHSVVVGAGGAYIPVHAVGNSGVDSTFGSIITGRGGGGGGFYLADAPDSGGSSGGGGAYTTAYDAGANNTPSYSGSGTNYSNTGGDAWTSGAGYSGAGGGGGAGGAASNATNTHGTAGGAGMTNAIRTGVSVTYAGGGGGSGDGSSAAGGSGGGGAGATTGTAGSGTVNTGSGGGGSTSGDSGGGGSGIAVVRYTTGSMDISVGNNMTLVSTTTVAQAAPTKGDIVLTYTNGAGTTTLGTDLTAEISADGGLNWTAMTLGSEGSTGSHSIATAHNVTIGTVTAPYNMAYRIKTLNQSASKTTRIQAVSLGWS